MHQGCRIASAVSNVTVYCSPVRRHRLSYEVKTGGWTRGLSDGQHVT